MTEHVPIRPRYQDFESVNTPLVVGTSHEGKNAAGSFPQERSQLTAQSVETSSLPVERSQLATPAASTKGIFTSIYDNKIIVIIIVIVIIIIALLAYVIYRKDDEPVKPKTRRIVAGKGVVSADSTDPKESADSTDPADPTDPKESTDPAKGTTTEPPKVRAKESSQDLQKLLARGQTVASTVVTPVEEPEEPEFDDEKAEQEILDLMSVESTAPIKSNKLEKSVEREDSVETEQTLEEKNVEPSNEHFSPEKNDPTDNIYNNAQSLVTPIANAQTLAFDPAFCSTMVKNHQCKRKPNVNGKCATHSKNT